MFTSSFRFFMYAAVAASLLFASLGATSVEARQADPSSPNIVAQNNAWVTLTSAAALYYLYSQHQSNQNYGPNGRYYMSNDGRVYYYNQYNQQPVWVNAPSQGIRVPYNTAYQYRTYRGYNRSYNGRTLRGMKNDNWQTSHPNYRHGNNGNNGNHYGNNKGNNGNHGNGNNGNGNNGNGNNGNHKGNNNH